GSARRRRWPRRCGGRRRPPAGLQPDQRGARRRSGACVPARRPGRARAVSSASPRMPAVSVKGLHKTYGSQEAVRGIDFEIAAGEVFGLLGPNGAGKTTTVEILEGYRTRDSGTVEVLGQDPQRADVAWRDRIGVVLQSSAMYPNLSVIESMEL